MVCLARGAAEGGEGEVDTEWKRRVGGGEEEGFKFLDHGAEMGGGVAEAADCAETA